MSVEHVFVHPCVVRVACAAVRSSDVAGSCMYVRKECCGSYPGGDQPADCFGGGVDRETSARCPTSSGRHSGGGWVRRFRSLTPSLEETHDENQKSVT